MYGLKGSKNGTESQMELKVLKRLLQRALLIVCLCPLIANSVEVDKVTSTYFLNFFRYIDWTAESFHSPTSPFFLCLDYKNPKGAVALNQLSREKIKGRMIVVLNRDTARSWPQAKCHIYYDLSGSGNLRSFPFSRKYTLIVSDDPSKIQSDIVLVREEDRLRFKLDLTRTGQASYTPNSKLARVAAEVTGRAKQ